MNLYEKVDTYVYNVCSVPQLTNILMPDPIIL